MSWGASYPVRVEGRLDDGHLSRWLWLVKWLLAVPHFIVLLFLWLGFVVVSVIAFFAILFTGRYPRALFDYNVGVLRWTWRVSYYAYGALGTDRYPPFSLRDIPDYPARLGIEYPEHLSRGLVLVKWWLLAIPHYIVVAFFLGGATIAVNQNNQDSTTGGPGLIGVLVLFAAIVLIVTGRYPKGVFDLVLGLNRWVLRVAAYAGLMTDRYPPLRLDMGGDEPGSLVVDTRQAPGEPPPPRPPAGPGRIIGAVVVSLVGLLGFGLLMAGFVLLAVDRTQRDSDDWLTSGSQSLSTSSAALVSEDIQLRFDAPDAVFGDVQVRATQRSDGELFVGIAERSDVSSYLAAFGHDVVTEVGGQDATYRRVRGDVAAPAPGDADFWAQSQSGTGEQVLTWTPSEGDWVLVVMNADGAPGVDVSAEVAAELPVLPWVAAGLMTLGLVVLGGSAVGVYLLLRRS